jgi:hypothetical protein
MDSWNLFKESGCLLEVDLSFIFHAETGHWSWDKPEDYKKWHDEWVANNVKH